MFLLFFISKIPGYFMSIWQFYVMVLILIIKKKKVSL